MPQYSEIWFDLNGNPGPNIVGKDVFLLFYNYQNGGKPINGSLWYVDGFNDCNQSTGDGYGCVQSIMDGSYNL